MGFLGKKIKPLNSCNLLLFKGLVESTPERIRTPNLLIRNLCDIFLCVKWAAIMGFHVVLFVVPKGNKGKLFPEKY